MGLALQQQEQEGQHCWTLARQRQSLPAQGSELPAGYVTSGYVTMCLISGGIWRASNSLIFPGSTSSSSSQVLSSYGREHHFTR